MNAKLFAPPYLLAAQFRPYPWRYNRLSGGVVPGATVPVTDVQRGVSRTLTTDQAGEYSAPSLIPGIYTVRADAKGFQTVERQNVAVEVGHDVRNDLTLQPGEQTQAITVTEAAPIINTTKSVISSAVESDVPTAKAKHSPSCMRTRPTTTNTGLMMRSDFAQELN